MPRKIRRRIADQYLKFTRWSEDDRGYVGYCPDLFPWGGVCHGVREETVFKQLSALVREEIASLRREKKPLPSVSTRPMREAVLA
jgi:hypothetical protein